MSLQHLVNMKTKRSFFDSESISRHLFCPICQDVFEDPMRTGCGHTFCYICITNWALVQKNCPMCKTSVRQRRLEKDLIASQIIDDLKVACVHQGCNWRGVYSIFKQHMRACCFRPRKTFTNEDIHNLVDISEEDDVLLLNQSAVLQVDGTSYFAINNV